MPHTQTIIDGIEYPSVTEIVGILDKSFLAYWRGKIGNDEANRISKESAQLGNDVHYAIDCFLKGETINFCGEESPIKTLFKAWFEWWISNSGEKKYTYVTSEVKVLSSKYKYGGTFDCILAKKNKLILVDWKISNNEDHYRILQLAGYALAHFEEKGNKIKKGLIVRIDKEGKVHELLIPNLWKYVPLFIKCRELYDFVKKKGKYAKGRNDTKRIKIKK